MTVLIDFSSLKAGITTSKLTFHPYRSLGGALLAYYGRDSFNRGGKDFECFSPNAPLIQQVVSIENSVYS